jgi:hypothetical protein
VKVAEAFVELRVDDKRAQAEVRQRASALGGTFAQFFGAAAFGAGAKKAIDAASELEQSLGAVESALGANSKAVKRWADDAARSMGLSKTAANNALVLIVSQLKNFGYGLDEATDKGMGLVELGADLAATYGGSTTEAVQALTSALRGEMDPIERYGVSLNEARVKAKALELGLYAGTGALEMNAKATAVLALITDQTATAQGQFAREAGTAAGANAIAAAEAENAAASMGEKLLPIYTRAVEVVGWLAQGFGSLPAPLQYAFLGLAAIAALSGPIGSLSGMVRSAITAVQGLGTAGRVTALSMGVLGGVVAVATLAYASYAKSKAEAKARTDEFIAALQAEARGQKDAALAAVAAQIDTARMAELARESGVSMEDVAAFIMGEYVPALDRLTTAHGDMGVMFNTSESSASEFSSALLGLKGEFADARDQVALTDAVMNDLGVTAADTGGDVSDLGDDVSDLEAAFADLLGTLDIRDASRNVAEAFDRIRDAYVAIWDAEDKRPIDEKVRDYEQAVDDATRKVVDWAETLGTVPPETVSKILAEVDKGSFDAALALMAQFEREAAVRFEARPVGGDPRGMRSLDVGGYVDRDQVAMVHRNEVVLPLGNPGRVAALLGDPRVAPSVAAAAGNISNTSGPSLSIGSLTVGSRDDLSATTGALDRLLWRVS